MSHGLIARSTLNNTVLISTDVEHLHFHGHAQNTGYTVQNTNYGGCVIFTYFSAAPGIPLIFLRSNGQLASVIKLTGGPGTWYFSVVQKSTSTYAPQALVFTQPGSLTNYSGNYGMQLRNAAGQIMFDSRLKPLSVIHTQGAIPAAIPCNSGRPPDAAKFVNQGEGQGSRPTLDWDFDTYQTEVNYIAPIVSDPIYASYSTAQACFERKITQYWYDYEYDGPEEHFRYMLWWCFYREAVKVTSGIVTSGWVPFKTGYKEVLYKQDGWWGGDYVNSVRGDYPFIQATINRTTNYVIVADGSIY